MYGHFAMGMPGPESAAPVSVSWLRGAKMIALGMSHSCALLPEDKVVCWGDNQHGELGDGTNTARGTGAPVMW